MAAERSNPPLYYILLHFWVQVFGTSEVALRSFSIPPSVGSLVLVYVLGRRLFTPAISLIALALQAVSVFQIAYAQEARTHAWLSFLVLTATLVLLEALKTTTARRFLWWSLYTLLAVACFYLHYISPFFFAAHGLFTLFCVLTGRQPFRSLVEHAVAGFLAAMAYLPQIRYILSGTGSINRSQEHLWLKLPQAYFSLLFGDTLLPLDQRAVANIRANLIEHAPYLIAALGAVLLLAPFAWRGFLRYRSQATVVYWMATVPILLCFIVSFKESVFDERYMLSASPFLFLILATAFAEIFGESRRAWRTAGLAGGVLYVTLGLIALFHLFFEPRFGKEEWRRAVAELEAQADPTRDRILLDPDYLHYPFLYYGRRDVPLLRLLAPERAALATRQGPLFDQLQGSRRLWLVRSHAENDDALTDLGRFSDLKKKMEYVVANRIEIYEFAPRR